MNTEKLKELFCKRLTQVRTQKGFSRYRLAKEAKVAESQIKRIEEGTYSPTLESVFILANALEVEAKDLLDFSKLPSGTTKDQK